MKKVISYIFSFILVIFIIFTCFISIFESTILSKEYVISKLEDANYYERMNGEIEEQFKSYTIQSGLSYDVIENLYTSDQLTQDINNVIDAIYTGKELEIDTTEIKENLQKNILTEVEQEGKTVDFDDVATKEYLNAIENAYESQVSYSTNIVNSIGNTFVKILDLSEKAQIVGYVGIAIIAVLIIIINRKQIVGLNYLAISAMASGLFIIACRLIAEFSMDLKNIMIMNQATSNVIQLIINDILTSVTMIGTVLAVVGILASIIYQLLHKKYFAKVEQ